MPALTPEGGTVPPRAAVSVTITSSTTARSISGMEAVMSVVPNARRRGEDLPLVAVKAAEPPDPARRPARSRAAALRSSFVEGVVEAITWQPPHRDRRRGRGPLPAPASRSSASASTATGAGDGEGRSAVVPRRRTRTLHEAALDEGGGRHGRLGRNRWARRLARSEPLAIMASIRERQRGASRRRRSGRASRARVRSRSIWEVYRTVRAPHYVENAS